MITAKDVGELCKEIEKALRDETRTPRRKTASRVVFSFTGQVAQYPSMGKDFFEYFPTFRTEILHLDYIGRELGFLHLQQSTSTYLPSMNSYQLCTKPLIMTSTTRPRTNSSWLEVWSTAEYNLTARE
jgi:acyl transferase domain-containing protein